MTYRWHSLGVVFLAALPIACSSDSSTMPQPEENVVRVDRFDVLPGETVEFPAGTRIQAALGADIAGDVVVDGSRPGDFTVACESGTLSLRGSIVVHAGPESASAGRKRMAPRKGTSVGLEAAPGGRLRIEGGRLEVGDGEDAFASEIGTGTGRFTADAGSDAGDVLLLTFGGTIEFVGAFPVFDLGTGGRGGDISVDREEYTVESPGVLELVAGRGGDSGRLVLEASEILNPPTLDDDDTIEGGIGGRGGNAWWDNSGSPTHADSEPVQLDTSHPVTLAVLRAGRGGDGAATGGNGGHAAYWGFGERSERDRPVMDAEVHGGRGGDVFGSPVPVRLAQGGDGGGYFATGNRGWNGAPHDGTGPVDGADGGGVLARGGDGGDVLAQVRCFSAVGGGGGHTNLSQATIQAELPLIATTTVFSDLAYGVLGGGGGSGGGRCGCPGGDGGDSGPVSVLAGDGGNVYATAAGSTGGAGGDVWLVGSSISRAGGGGGDPVGSGGDLLEPTVLPGEGGSADTPGADGQQVVEAWVPGEGVDGEPCEEDGVACDDPPPPEDDYGCVGAFQLTANWYREDDAGTTSFREVREISGFSHGNGNWEVYDATIRRTTIEPDTTIVETIEYNGNDAYSLAEPQCDVDGVIMWPEVGGVDLNRVYPGNANSWDSATVTLEGCNPALSSSSQRSRFYCCGGTRVCYDFGASGDPAP